jgi:hypothetical protein
MHKIKMYYPVTTQVMKEITYDDGGLLWWETAIEVTASSLLCLTYCAIASRMDAVFGVIWVALMGAVSFFTLKPFHLRIFTRRPATKTIRMVGADVPQDLVNRYQAASAELDSVMEEINALAVTEDVEKYWRK